MKIRIRKCSVKYYWYKDLIGEEFFVVEKENIGYRVEYKEYFNKYIEYNDAEIFSTKEKLKIMIKPEEINYEFPMIGSGLKNLEAEQCMRALCSNLVRVNKSFEDYFTLEDMGNISISHLNPLMQRECLEISPDGNSFKVTEKFLQIVSKFKK